MAIPDPSSSAKSSPCWLCGAEDAHHTDDHGPVCCRCFQEEFDHCSNIRFEIPLEEKQ
jgi:hypothetical protein